MHERSNEAPRALVEASAAAPIVCWWRRLCSCPGWLACLILLLLLACSSAVTAQDERAAVRFDGKVIFRVGPSGETDATMRARRIEQRLATLLDNPAAITKARIENVAGSTEERAIRIAAVTVATVLPADAEDNVTSIDTLAARWAAAIDGALGDTRLRHRSGWVRFGTQVGASVRSAFSRLGESAIRVVPGALAALLVIALFWAIASGVRAMMRAIFSRIVDDLTVENLIKQIAYYFVWIIGVFVAADALGFEPQSVVTGLGLTSLALGFALKDILSNFVSGLLILFMRPFEIGDQIAMGDTEGSVERIDLRATQIRTYDGRLSLVPNAELFTSRIINNTASPRRRGVVEVFAGYDADLTTLVPLLCQAASAADGVLADPPPNVLVARFTGSDIILEVRFWSDSRRTDFVGTGSAVRHAIIAALKEAGVALPDPAVRALVPRDAAAWRDALGTSAGNPAAG